MESNPDTIYSNTKSSHNGYGNGNHINNSNKSRDKINITLDEVHNQLFKVNFNN